MPRRIETIPIAIGGGAIDGLAYIGGLASLTGKSAYIVFVGPFRGQRLRPQRAVHQAFAVGVEASPGGGSGGPLSERLRADGDL